MAYDDLKTRLDKERYAEHCATKRFLASQPTANEPDVSEEDEDA